MTTSISMNPNLLVQYLQKEAADFTRDDIIRYCRENMIPILCMKDCKTINLQPSLLVPVVFYLTKGLF